MAPLDGRELLPCRMAVIRGDPYNVVDVVCFVLELLAIPTGAVERGRHLLALLFEGTSPGRQSLGHLDRLRCVRSRKRLGGRGN